MRELIFDETKLRTVCRPVETIDAGIADLVNEMRDTVLAHQNPHLLFAVGLAAPQLGEDLNIFIIQTPPLELVAIHPLVTKIQGSSTNWNATCLSLPGVVTDTKRPKMLKFRYQDLTGEWHSAKFHDLFAVIAAHEIDHLHGRLITDRQTPLDWL